MAHFGAPWIGNETLDRASGGVRTVHSGLAYHPKNSDANKEADLSEQNCQPAHPKTRQATTEIATDKAAHNIPELPSNSPAR